jgi:hypothetical protein
MSELIVHTIQDLRTGRESWRVIVLFSLPALLVGLVLGLPPLGV